ncbi:hypothetical protein LOAG_06670 [Loa loa]|uniref:Uncharacterized protein n=1 Tax=Loa loa TaxID=7209 RepID=A0A1S0TXX3_LOALO|nr:hypothetical protein LOAG_06670 [Loa loa]EFO21814.1 hypothetical protein LOAG_06670 [Loa loa]
MLIASVLFCYIPYRRLAIIKEKLENISGTHVRYVNLIKHLLNMTNCKQISWSTWDQCTAKQQNITRQRELSFADCQLIYENISCDCSDNLIENIQEIDENSYVRYGCIPGSNQQLAMLSINATIVNVSIKNLSGIIFEPCIINH